MLSHIYERKSTEMLAYKEKIHDWFEAHKQEMLLCLQELVRVPSVASDPEPNAPYGKEVARALDTALAMAERFGLETKNYDYRIGEAVLPGTSGKSLGMIGHLDVVPVSDGWSFPPFEGHIDENGFIVGRGVADDKEGAVLGLFVMRCIRELGLPFPHEIKLLFGCDEETGMTDVAYYAEHARHADLYLVPDAGFPVCFAEKGICGGTLRSKPVTDGSILGAYAGMASNVVPDSAWVELPGRAEDFAGMDTAAVTVSAGEKGVRFTAKGISSHAAEPERSENAIFVLASFLLGHSLLSGQAREAFLFVQKVLSGCKGEGLGIQTSHPDTGCLTCIGGMLRFDGCLTLNINIRYPQSTDGASLEAAISACAAENGFVYEDVSDSAGTYHAPDDPLVTTLTAIYNDITGQDAKPYMMGGGTYARHLPNAVAFGPEMELDGIPACPYKGGVHQTDEHYHVLMLMSAAEVYCNALLAIAENPAIL